ncbi:ABC transporter permease [uncultured Fretibacterium sp.]|uniref:ABC transporter permease n=2 Tax=uncultured Fretibacterium sp. TaxID=1678694 RepID=UPI0026018CD5|nr:ABC transporter permease [uncultured Fretibacterium sp.]
MRYVVKRLLSLIPVLFVVSILVFSLMHLAPGDPASAILGMEATAADLEHLKEELGLNLPLYEQYARWVVGVLHGDLGRSYFMEESVGQAIAGHFRPTLSLALFAELIALVLALPAGIYAACRRGRPADRIVMLLSLLALAVPSFILGLLLILLLGVLLALFPIGGYAPLEEGLLPHLRYLVLPALALGSTQAALIARMTRAAMAEVLDRNFIRTLVAKGMRGGNVVGVHALRNALFPILTAVGQSMASLLSGAIVVETVFNIPGLGQLLINSIARRDFAMIQGIVLVVTVICVLVNLLVDLLYGVADPRVRLDKP